jgi:hypothetical protein
LTRLLVSALILGLAGLAFTLLSRLNARTFTLQRDDAAGALVVHKGRALPIGSEPYRPSDPLLADTYAPIPLEGLQAGAVLERRYTERDELDRALFEVLERLARPRVASDEPRELDRGLYYVRRAEKLQGLTEEQRLSLRSMQSELAYYLARVKLDDARKLLGEALTQLQTAADSGNRHARSAHQMLLEVQPPAKALEESLRKAVHRLSEPAPASPTPEAPGPAAPAP